MDLHKILSMMIERKENLIYRRNCLFSLFLLLSSIVCLAQQEPNFTMYNFNLNIINPAYVSVHKYSEANLSYRSQWTGVPYAPNTAFMSYTAPMNDRLGFGLSVVHDEIFILNKTDASFDFAAEVQFSDDYYVHFGLKASASFVNIDLTKAGAPDRDMLFSKNESYVVPTLGAGVYLSHPKYYVSVSTPNASRVEKYSLGQDLPAMVVNYFHLYVGGGYIARINKDLKITPAIMSRFIAGTTPTYDISATMNYMNNIVGGLNYRWKETVSLYSLFSSKSNFKFGFSYDMNVADIAKVNSHGSFELLLRYRWN